MTRIPPHDPLCMKASVRGNSNKASQMSKKTATFLNTYYTPLSKISQLVSREADRTRSTDRSGSEQSEVHYRRQNSTTKFELQDTWAYKTMLLIVSNN